MSARRYRIEPGDVPAAVIARRMGLSEASFLEKLPELEKRGFPSADPTTGNYDLQAVDAWRRSRHARLFLTNEGPARDATVVCLSRLGAGSG